MNTAKIVKIGLFTAIISIMSLMSIPTSPIPFSLSLIGIFLTGALLPPRDAFLSCLCYLLLGIVGLPVFAGFRGGFQVLVGYTGGFLLSYPFVAYTVATSKKLLKWRGAMILGMVLGLIICYFFGCLVFIAVSGSTVWVAITTCIIPYVLFDVLKIIISSILAFAIGKAIKN